MFPNTVVIKICTGGAQNKVSLKIQLVHYKVAECSAI